MKEDLNIKDYAIVSGLTLIGLLCLPLIAIIGLFGQAAFVITLPIFVLLGLAHAFTSAYEPIKTKIHGVLLSSDMRINKSHIYAKKIGSQFEIGMDDFAKHVFGKIQNIEFAKGKICKGDLIAKISNGQRELSLYSPMNGIIKETNINGFLKIESKDKDSYKQMYGYYKAIDWMRNEVDKLIILTSPKEMGYVSMADGGELSEEISKDLDDETWNKVKEQFFS